MAEKKRSLQLHPQGPAPGETVAGHQAVQTVETYGGPVRLRWDPAAAVTAFGQMPYFIEFLKTAGLFEDWVEDCPLDYRSPNAPAKRDVLGTLLLSVLARPPPLCAHQLDSQRWGEPATFGDEQSGQRGFPTAGVSRSRRAGLLRLGERASAPQLRRAAGRTLDSRHRHHGEAVVWASARGRTGV